MTVQKWLAVAAIAAGCALAWLPLGLIVLGILVLLDAITPPATKKD